MSIQNTQNIIPHAEKSSFALAYAKKRSIQYLKKHGLEDQICHIPNRYPVHQNSFAALDIAVRGKILKAHLEDAFSTNRFSVKITRRQITSVITVIHDRVKTQSITEITKLYANDTTKINVVKYQGNPPDDPDNDSSSRSISSKAIMSGAQQFNFK